MEVFAHLPDDVWTPIFQQLPVSDLPAVSLVCKAWHKHANEVPLAGGWACQMAPPSDLRGGAHRWSVAAAAGLVGVSLVAPMCACVP